MTDQYKATTYEQWERQERRARLHALDDQDAPCLLELRDRIEALEAAQQPRAFTGQVVAPITGSAVPGVALYLDPSERQHGVTSDRLIARDTPSPAGSLVDRVTWLIAKRFSESSPGTDCTPFGRAAILEVAAAILDWWDSDEVARTGWEAAKWLEQEASR
jgi:hypothetical protein